MLGAQDDAALPRRAGRTPVGRPKPKRRTHLSKRFAPSVSPTITEPTFDDSLRICATLLMPAAAVVRLAHRPVGDLDLRRHRRAWSSGSTSFSSIAPETVNALKVEPGS